MPPAPSTTSGIEPDFLHQDTMLILVFLTLPTCQRTIYLKQKNPSLLGSDFLSLIKFLTNFNEA